MSVIDQIALDQIADERDKAQQENKQLKDRIKRLEDAGDALKAAGYFGGFNDAVDKWIKVKEAKL